MSGIENLAIFLATTTSTLLGFAGVIFIFWANVNGKHARDKLKQHPWIVRDFYFLVILAVGILIICFNALYNATIEPNGIWQTFFLQILTCGFIIFIIFMSLFFIAIVKKI